MAEKRDLFMFLVLWIFTVLFFMLETYSDPSTFGITIVFSILGGLCLMVLFLQKNDEPYCENLKPIGLLLAVGGSIGMIVVSMLFTSILGMDVFSMQMLTVTAAPTSVITSFLYSSLFTVALVATGEELIKLSGYSELKARKYKYLAILVPVGLWAAYHGIQAYANPLMIIPAFINGILLIGLLEVTKSFLAPIIAHGLYNSVILFMQYLSGSSATLPLIPATFEITDVLLVILAALWVVLVVLPILKRDKANKRKTS